ncbi:hypothetical protein M422DRAFT_243856 [Sphaerobolus stellatus SS14]|nr:hypothetical protein M422DRAFT_243856 [Sphaerobolus stellatus SS14]
MDVLMFNQIPSAFPQIKGAGQFATKSSPHLLGRILTILPSRLMPSLTVILYFAFIFLGNALLLLLLTTLLLSKKLPQRTNHFLTNVFITNYLATIPPSLLFISGHFNDNVPDPPKTLCIIQSALVDGVVPMQETATILILRSEVAFKDIVLS